MSNYNFILIDEKTGEWIEAGAKRTMSRGEQVEVTSFEVPRHRGSTGRVYVKFANDITTAGYYPSVVDAKFVRVIEFESTGEAYDACQTDEDILSGDILIIRKEDVIGIADTWPFAVTEKFGKLHTLANEADASNDKWRASINAARQIKTITEKLIKQATA